MAVSQRIRVFVQTIRTIRKEEAQLMASRYLIEMPAVAQVLSTRSAILRIYARTVCTRLPLQLQPYFHQYRRSLCSLRRALPDSQGGKYPGCNTRHNRNDYNIHTASDFVRAFNKDVWLSMPCTAVLAVQRYRTERAS